MSACPNWQKPGCQFRRSSGRQRSLRSKRTARNGWARCRFRTEVRSLAICVNGCCRLWGIRHNSRGLMAELKVKSEIAGSVWKIEVAVGDEVAEEDPLIILESMKMEIPLVAPRAGTIIEILVTEGEAIGEGD